MRFFFITFFIYLELFGVDDNEGGKSISGLLALPICIYWFIYFIYVEALYGGTLGHQALNLRVVNINGKEIGLTQALKRHLCDWAELSLFGIPAIIVIKTTEKHQRLGDLWANTVVIDLKDLEQLNIPQQG